MTGQAWDEPGVAALRRMVDEGASSGVIAAALGLSRNAVVGKCHRLGLRLGPIAPGASRVCLKRGGDWSAAERRRLRDLAATLGAEAIAIKLGRTPAAVRRQATAMGVSLARARPVAKPAKAVKPARPVVADLPAPTGEERAAAFAPFADHHVDLAGLTRGCCRWPIDRDGATFYCGAARTRGPYCDRHAALARRAAA
jgi:hypothetical protein